jgi:hypothetical protein
LSFIPLYSSQLAIFLAHRPQEMHHLDNPAIMGGVERGRNGDVLYVSPRQLDLTG